ncbi:MAG: IS1634 family transposase, partial [Bryobacteraceae bacterium]
MYVATVPNRNSPPAILLRESYRENGKVKTRTLANITHLGAHKVEALRRALSGSLPTAGVPLTESFAIARSLPHGHVAAVLGCLRNLQLDSILDPLPGRQRDLVIAMIVARIIEPASKLATARGLHADTLHHSLGEVLRLDSADETEL